MKGLPLGATEKFTISITDRGLAIRNAQGACVDFSPDEALMLLDILEHEVERLRALAAERAPLPVRFRFSS